MFAFIIAVMLQGTAEKETFKQLLFFSKLVFTAGIVKQNQQWFPLIYSMQMCSPLSFSFQVATSLQLGCSHYS